MPITPSNCTVCTSTCTAVCGESCTGGCSKECTNECTGTCKESCALECTGSCQESCSTSCQDTCGVTCETQCISTCAGLCQGCTGCTNQCEGTCGNTCLNSCNGESTSSGTRVVTEDEVLNYIANLKFKRIDDFDENPAIFDVDKLITTIDPTKKTETDTLDAISVLMESDGKKTFKASAAQLMDYFNHNLKNCIMWKPYIKDNKLHWERTNDDTIPEPVDLITINAELADENTDGLMSKELFVKLQGIDIDNYYDKPYIDTLMATLPDTYAAKDHVHNQYMEKDNAYTKTEIDEFLKKYALSDHNHDDVYLSINDAESTYETKNNVTNKFTDYYNKDQIDKKLADITINPDEFKTLASATENGLMTSEHFVYIESLPSLLAGIKNSIPTKNSELTNDSNYLTLGTLPVISESTKGIVGVSADSRISINDGYIDIKNFGIVNHIRNSTFANGSNAWTGDPINIMEVTNNDGEYSANFIFASQNSINQTVYGTWDSYATFTVEIKGTGTLNIKLGESEKELVFDSTDWKRYSVEFDTKTTSDITNLNFSITNKSDDDIYVSMRHLMLQCGKISTEWYPHYLDGAAVTNVDIPYATTDTYGISKPDGKTISIENGILSIIPNIKDDDISEDTIWSSKKINDTINGISSLELLGENNSTPSIRMVDNRNDDTGYGIITKKTSTNFIIGVTNNNDSHGDLRENVIPMRINLETGLCNINGNAMTADSAKCDSDGNVISDTYLYTDDPGNLFMSEDDIKALFAD